MGFELIPIGQTVVFLLEIKVFLLTQKTVVQELPGAGDMQYICFLLDMVRKRSKG
jgi:hypothetical protein